MITQAHDAMLQPPFPEALPASGPMATLIRGCGATSTATMGRGVNDLAVAREKKVKMACLSPAGEMHTLGTVRTNPGKNTPRTHKHTPKHASRRKSGSGPSGPGRIFGGFYVGVVALFFLHFFAFFAFAFSVLPICIFSPPPVITWESEEVFPFFL